MTMPALYKHKYVEYIYEGTSEDNLTIDLIVLSVALVRYIYKSCIILSQLCTVE